MLSQTAEYALRTVIHLAEAGDGARVSVGDIARALDVPQNYLSKTCYALVRAGVLTSTRGPSGGFRLAREPARLSLLAVVSPFDAIGGRRQCLLGRPTCSDRRACAVHDNWKRTAEEVARFFRTTTVADIVRPGSPATPATRRSA